jgi:hypothetical protein
VRVLPWSAAKKQALEFTSEWFEASFFVAPPILGFPVLGVPSWARAWAVMVLPVKSVKDAAKMSGKRLLKRFMELPFGPWRL